MFEIRDLDRREESGEHGDGGVHTFTILLNSFQTLFKCLLLAHSKIPAAIEKKFLLS